MASCGRDKLRELVGVRCIFPSGIYCDPHHDFTARCLLENVPGTKPQTYKDTVEDIIVRLKVLPKSEEGCGEPTEYRIKVSSIIVSLTHLNSNAYFRVPFSTANQAPALEIIFSSTSS